MEAERSEGHAGFAKGFEWFLDPSETCLFRAEEAQPIEAVRLLPGQRIVRARVGAVQVATGPDQIFHVLSKVHLDVPIPRSQEWDERAAKTLERNRPMRVRVRSKRSR